ncbi:MAG: UvrABC system protein B [Pirellulaceae bacterium]|nr:MAG: UvrABC system protein B [Pirellulaceae bacterium]
MIDMARAQHYQSDRRFELHSPYQPAGDQPAAIEALVRGLREGKRFQVLMGVTGSGKTFTMANVIAAVQRPTLVISHNKTLAAQLYAEFRQFFPNNAVRYFISYYDYYQPEAYIPQRDLYIEKDASINEDIEKLRLAATVALTSRRDVIVVASVSCIYGLGEPDDFVQMSLALVQGHDWDRDALLARLVAMQYERSDMGFSQGTFRVRGDSIEIWPTYERHAVRVEMWGDQIEQLSFTDPTTGRTLEVVSQYLLFPSKHFVVPEERIRRACRSIEQELNERLAELRAQGKKLEADRLLARTRYDLECLEFHGSCKGIENYSRHLSGRKPGEPPYTLLDYFPEECLVIVDESHVTVPQLRAMHVGDRNRKLTLVEHGFRLPSALDNRPLTFEEWEARVKQAIFVSATPGPYELEKCGGEIVEQIVRPTGLLDPVLEVVPARHQVSHLLEQIRERAAAGERVLVTTLTKRSAEDLAHYLRQKGVRCRWLHSELDAFERVELLRDLRAGQFDCLVGVNLLREGLDLPEVSLVAILDADKEGFLRSATSLIQTIGRAARNVNAKVILYADTVTQAMQEAIDETQRRRQLQEEYNARHRITPETIRKSIEYDLVAKAEARRVEAEALGESEDQLLTREYIAELEKEMFAAAENLEFERAAALRDRIIQLREKLDGKTTSESAAPPSAAAGRASHRGSPRSRRRSR